MEIHHPNGNPSILFTASPHALGYILKNFIFNFVKPHATILKRRRGDCRHQQQGGVKHF
jgi:hypothetical protein